MKTISRKQLNKKTGAGATVQAKPKVDPSADAAKASAEAAAQASAAAQTALEVSRAFDGKLSQMEELLRTLRAQMEQKKVRGPVTAHIVRDDDGRLEQVVFETEEQYLN